MKKIGIIIFIAVLAFWCYWLLEPSINDFLLKREASCVKGVITSDSVRVRYHDKDLKYIFVIDGVKYSGNSLQTSERSIGDSICIVYLRDRPSVNKPLKYFEDDQLKCSCK